MAEPTNLATVAASLIQPAQTTEPKPLRQERAAQAAPDPVEPGDIEEDEGDETLADDTGSEDGGRPDEGTTDEGGDQDADDAPPLEVKGDPWIEVKVDGELMHIRLSELKSSYSGDQVIAKRLQEATEARNDAVRARDVAVEQERHAARDVVQHEVETLRTQTSQLAAVYQHYGQALLQPTVQAPNEAMRAADPIGYLTQMDAYRHDQGRLQAQAAHMQEVVRQAELQEEQRKREYRQEQFQALVQEVPAMADEGYRRAQVTRVMGIGQAVGFTEAEIRMYSNDRRVIYLAMLAAKGAEDMIKTRKGGVPTVKVKAAAPPQKATIRAANGQYKQRDAALEQAKSSGDYRDVAKTLLVNAPSGGAPRRR
jgi:myosin heavy subunit